MKQRIIFTGITAAMLSCGTHTQKQTAMHLIALDPGHFHASLVQQQMYPGIDSTIHVFAPGGPEVKQYLASIERFNQQTEPLVHWATDVYTGPDYLEKMLQEPPGNIIVIAGNNRLKATYIRRAVNAGQHVLADKPMAIDAAGFDSLQASFREAATKKVQLYDIMTERYEIRNTLQRELSQLPDVFGTLETGTTANPAVVKNSVHHFKKLVAGKTMVRPAWYMDETQQGEGIVDVTTHLVDLVQWTCFPGQTLDFHHDIKIDSARRWATTMTFQQYADITGQPQYPDYLLKNVDKDSILHVYANGAFDYTVKGVHANISVTWNYQAPEGTGDTHYSLLRGSKASLVIRQGAEQQYKPVLYIESAEHHNTAYAKTVADHIASLAQKYPGLALKANDNGWEVIIPEALAKKHEALFGKVMQQFLEYIRHNNMPAWEVPNMLAKYYTTTQALELAKKQ
ncbi:putative oxidoreductase C-terminal domain-containing protein [Chitinophaga qingshengii]|uniref:Gfo/Idh/MocA family oxidoreductase n=1 Tax=Chitinophaga qingshengii TaxID=1569794 RepID=A0ABR7TJA9_9BACT|nr:putative oxidoreductase C-terminal domain-containing protein [Chitinophaga qingshengii]MBC9929504.1 Gfo/Idh/MocA family oxidoreductase [Chitinophaga qingshengii]